MMMVRSRGIIGLSDYRGGRDIWSRVRLGSIAYRGVLVRRKAQPRAHLRLAGAQLGRATTTRCLEE
jgi:hypothetical protein